MPASKKKKKLTNNPARGFSTTSTASKAKPQDPDENNLAPKSEEVAGTSDNQQAEADALTGDDGKVTEKPLHELSPEELEKQLEESNLQAIIETYGLKVKKDAARQLSRLQTERRIMRAQATPLITRTWLSEEIMQLIQSQLDPPQTAEDILKDTRSHKDAASDTSEESLLTKLWTLRQILPQLGFSLASTEKALHELLLSIDKPGHDDSLTTKESIWGLERCITWLSRALSPGELPSFEPVDVQKLKTSDRKSNPVTSVKESGKDFSYAHFHTHFSASVIISVQA